MKFLGDSPALVGARGHIVYAHKNSKCLGLTRYEKGIKFCFGCIIDKCSNLYMNTHFKYKSSPTIKAHFKRFFFWGWGFVDF